MAAHDAPDPRVRDNLGRALDERQDPRWPPPLDWPGSRGRWDRGRPRTTGPSRVLPQIAPPRDREGTHAALGDGRAVRQSHRVPRRSRRQHAPWRHVDRIPWWQRHRWSRPWHRNGRVARQPSPRRGSGLGGYLWGRRCQYGAYVGKRQHRDGLEAAADHRLRKQHVRG